MRSACLVVLIITTVAFLPTSEAVVCSLADLKGLFVTVFTPVYEDGGLNVGAVSAYAQFLKDNEVDGVIVAATWGEGPTLNTSDNKLLLDAWMAVGPSLGLYIISDVGAEPLPDAQDMAAYSEEVGVDALMVLPPVFYKPKTTEALVYYLNFIYEAAPNTPMIYDDNQNYTLVEVDLGELLELATEEIPTFKGIKSDDFEGMLAIQNQINDDQMLYVVDYLGPAVLMGFESFVIDELNYDPELAVDIVRNGQSGNVNETRDEFYELLEITETLIEDVNPIAAEKEATSLVSGNDLGDVRPPLPELTEEEKASIESRLEELNITLADSR